MDDKSFYMLFDFFADCFNQDWPLEADSPDEIIANYLKAVSKEQLPKLSELVADYSEKFASDPELEKHLLSDLSCYYSPSLDGLSAKAWLKRVARQLLEAARP